MPNDDAPTPNVHRGPLEAAASELGERHRVTTQAPLPVAVWVHIGAVRIWLEHARLACADAPSNASKAAEWLLDNDHQIERTLRHVAADLPSAFYRRLPALAGPEEAGLPRAFALAHGLLRSSYLQLSLAGAVRFIQAYQERAPLTIAELWAFPTMLRLVCLETLVAAFARLIPELKPPFKLSPWAAAPAVLEDTECVARSIANLAVLSSIPWKDFFDQTSRVEAILRTDPAGFYPQMDFATRDRYRKSIEELARSSRRSEPDIASGVIAKARARLEGEPRDLIGHWLVAEGREELESEFGCRPPARIVWNRWLSGHAPAVYAVALAVASVGALLLPAFYLASAGASLPVWLLGIVVAAVPASVLGVTVVHWIIALIVPPRLLPKLDFEDGIPPEYATAAVVPVLVGKADDVRKLIDRLEAHRLANPDPSLRFVLLSDYPDASAERTPEDDALVTALANGVQRLNERYERDGNEPFHLLHRSRCYNAREGVWMGWERKRGKLEQFNDFVVSGDASAFSTVEGDPDALSRIRFVVTVDADTTLPPGSVSRLVGALAHPLNRAEFDPRTGRVMRGYTIIQPRLEIAPESDNRSLFTRLYAGDTAIDIYSRAVSNIYQDLFGTGIYAGKGIYDVVSFRRTCCAQVPENALLSHDLFEGVHGRTGLASDIVLYETFPTGYLEYARRWHRWLRGDWQLLPWLARLVRHRSGELRPNQLSGLDRWKIVDNLRRSLIPPGLIMFAAVAWLVLPGRSWVWTGLTVAALGGHLFTDLVTGMGKGRRRGAVQGALRRLRNQAGPWLFSVVFLANDSVVACDAILRTLWRLAVTRRHLLKWVSASDMATYFAVRNSRADFWRHMWLAPFLSITLAAAIWLVRPAALVPAGLLLAVWVAAPEIAAFISRPRRVPVERLDSMDRKFLRRQARRTWLYFETFVGPEENWLPPDNFQEDPHKEIAHRTSPTNVGMMFLSSLAAWDLGFVSLIDFSTRVRHGLDILARLERYQGHFFNWYDTKLLTVLEPRYVSTVDSGNLAVCLIALKEGCAGTTLETPLRAALWDGLSDTLELLKESIEKISDGSATEALGRMVVFAEQVNQARDNPKSWRTAVIKLCECELPALESAVAEVVAGSKAPRPQDLHEVQAWLERVHHHVMAMRRDIESLLPWLSLLEIPPASCSGLARQVGEILSPAMPLARDHALGRALALMGEAAPTENHDSETARWIADLKAAITAGAQHWNELREAMSDIATRSESLAFEMDFRFLFDMEQRLFHIGYNASSHHIDSNHYDLLATEARLASYFAIAKRDVPYEHWSFLGRPLARLAGGLSLVSWNGSMFEYLMPALLLRSIPGTLLGESERTAVDAQRRYAVSQGIPWGISESAFASRDPDQRYQYGAFGVPNLGLNRELTRDLVVTPYATALALAVRPQLATRHLRELERLGLVGQYGFIEAADFTPQRIPEGSRYSPVRTYMAHHQGMILAAIGNALTNNALVRRFHADRRMHTMELLLQERVPWEVSPESLRAESKEEPSSRKATTAVPYAWVPSTNLNFPQVHALGNGRLATWISAGGGGALFWRDFALTRWLPDATRDCHGLWIYARDVESGTVWSVAHQPTGVTPESAHVVFHPHLAEFNRQDNGIATRLEVGVAPGDDIEIRRVTVINESDRPRRLQLTSYAELVLAPPLQDERHPAFSKLFVGSEHVPDLHGLLFTRRPREPGDSSPVLLHYIVSDDRPITTGFETDRRLFLGRNGSVRRPHGVVEGLTGTTGWTLDPVMALQLGLDLAPQEQRQVAFLTIAAGSRASVLETAERYTTLATLDWVLADASADAGREAQQLALPPEAFSDLQKLASLLLYPHPALRADPAIIAENRLGQPQLWGLGLSGDYPMLLVRVGNPRETQLLRLLIRAHLYWRRRGIYVDLVVLRTGASSYEEPMRDRIATWLQDANAQALLGRKGGIHLLFADQIGENEARLLQAVARVVLDEARGPLALQLAGIAEPQRALPRFEPTGATLQNEATSLLPRPTDLQFDNGFGGFSGDGREYVIHLEPGMSTPSPWSNVLANDAFGCIVTEAGGGFTWAVNSGENRLTPWTNDPIADPPGEGLYLRDEESAEFWTPTPQPVGADAACQIRHGAGYTKWHSRSHGLEQELLVFVPPDDPVKVLRLQLRNMLPHARRITATYYAEWLLGALRSISKPFVVCEFEADWRALLARNPWNPDFAERVAFLTSNLPPHDFTTDRQEFIGFEGDLREPAALRRWGLGRGIRPGADACAAFQVHLDIGPQDTAEVVFVLGQGRDRAHAEELVRRWQQPDRVEHTFKELNEHWDKQLGAVRVHTPDPAFDLMTNRWLPYQTMASRILARAGFYQAGGAVGFRDQLQDVLAILWSDPARTRAHILACAARQFEEGDVLHWWHPPNDRGVRTRCSDDLMWLVYATVRYIEATGDESILREEIAFLHAPPLSHEEQSRYARFDVTPDRRSLLEHCERALEHGVTRGMHGLPLIGSGDWNDGMNRVGRNSRGESAWLAWFAIVTMEGFANLCSRLDRNELTERWTLRARELRNAVDETAWDGGWYLRAYDDDGRPWGSASNDECRIDSIAQSWAVLARTDKPERVQMALTSATRELIRDEDGLIRLLWPPFDQTPRDPGYIKAYPPGIRENGGQYTHAAAWLGWAFAELGDGDQARRVFDIINPIHHSSNREDAERYLVEPYVIAADIGSVPPHVGRGGWTWYTGSAAWTWRLGVERILGLRMRGGCIVIDPCLPKDWGSFEAEVRGPAGTLLIRVDDPDRLGSGDAEVTVDGLPPEQANVVFPSDGSTRHIHVRLRPRPAPVSA